GVPVRDVLVADASRRTKAVNAYVSGLGPTRRVVVYDTLLREATPAEVTSVVAHELGHAKDRDVWVGTLTGALGAAAAVVALYLIGSWAPLLRLAGVDSVAEPRAVPLLIALVTVVGLVAAPVQALVSRRVEARADAH
ncbi:M48 family peptidase, partial [Micromonospora sp. BL1]|uniref:M48 family metalloprotease n=1 Tax=Micromonospora sp. BL1 TaxID=2478709 RepID=UPI000F1BD1FB